MMHPATPHRPHFVYRCSNAAGELLYIGCTVDLRARLSAHRNRSDWFDQVRRVNLVGPFIGKDARSRALSVEARLIAENRPPFNCVDRGAAIRAARERRREAQLAFEADPANAGVIAERAAAKAAQLAYALSLLGLEAA